MISLLLKKPVNQLKPYKLGLLVVLSRYYNYTPKEVYGYRPLDERRQQNYNDNNLVTNYTKQQTKNRIKNCNLVSFVSAYRQHAHLYADIDPLGMNSSNSNSSSSSSSNNESAVLDPQAYGLTKPKQEFNVDGIFGDSSSSSNSDTSTMSLDSIVSKLESTYKDKIGFEFSHIPSNIEKDWIANKIESTSTHTSVMSKEEKLRLFMLLTKSEVFDNFLGKKFPQVKRYGLEGGESMMTALDTLFKHSSQNDIKDIIACMPHRGRLNLLTGILGFDQSRLFHKIKGNPEYPTHKVPHGLGDVISHIAASVDVKHEDKSVHVSLLHNPSHLEAANPVAMGKSRAKQLDLLQTYDTSECSLGDKVMCVQLHGDAAFTGQGVVTETLGLSNLPSYTCGGSIHLIVNNQVGYTTTEACGRSTKYSSDIGKMVDSPIIHVNGDHPEQVAKAMKIAFEYRQEFKKDVIVDLIVYRRWGHNELDEPSFTQPLMYKVIRNRPSVPKLYEDKLVSEGILTSEEISKVREDYFKELEASLEKSYSYEPELDSLQGKWSKMQIVTSVDNETTTGVDIDTLKEVGIKSVAVPEDFTPHKRLKKFHMDNRVTKLNQDGGKLDWATAEAMMFGTLLKQGYDIRISGQDVGRGTFSQRHAMLVDQNNENVYIPLNNISNDTNNTGKLEIANSHLSEFAVLGFETGVSWENPDRLVIWEAQFGDFFNGGQIIIDTFISSGEAKWFRQSGLVMLLPHGYDGAGPEHSSCRMERFLQLCDSKFDTSQVENPNMHVVYPTTPSQYFHVMRRQMLRKYRKPLIVVGPKTLLRHPEATSTLQEMSVGTKFLPVIGDSTVKQREKVEKVIMMSGKLYYDLVKKRSELQLDDKVAILRLEELCPFPANELQQELSKYSNCKDFVWVQEEPQNQGAYTFLAPRIEQVLKSKLRYVGREAIAAPAVGVASMYKVEQESVLSGAFNP